MIEENNEPVDEMTIYAREQKIFYSKAHFKDLYDRKDKRKLYNALDVCLTAQTAFSKGFTIGYNIKLKEKKIPNVWLSVTKNKHVLINLPKHTLLLLKTYTNTTHCGYYYSTGFRDSLWNPLKGVSKFMVFPEEFKETE